MNFLVKGLALAAPWGAIELMLTRFGHANLGFVAGLLLGLVCLYVTLPRDMALWRLLLIGAILCLLRPIIGMLVEGRWR